MSETEIGTVKRLIIIIIIIIIIIMINLMKYFSLIGAIPMVSMAQSAANWRNTHTHTL